MRLYWFDASSFCPMDKGLLKKEGQITLDVYSCPNCDTKYVRLAGQTISGSITGISDGFTKPKEIYTGKKPRAQDYAMTLKMTLDMPA